MVEREAARVPEPYREIAREMLDQFGVGVAIYCQRLITKATRKGLPESGYDRNPFMSWEELGRRTGMDPKSAQEYARFADTVLEIVSVGKKEMVKKASYFKALELGEFMGDQELEWRIRDETMRRMKCPNCSVRIGCPACGWNGPRDRLSWQEREEYDEAERRNEEVSRITIVRSSDGRSFSVSGPRAEDFMHWIGDTWDATFRRPWRLPEVTQITLDRASNDVRSREPAPVLWRRIESDYTTRPPGVDLPAGPPMPPDAPRVSYWEIQARKGTSAPWPQSAVVMEPAPINTLDVERANPLRHEEAVRAHEEDPELRDQRLAEQDAADEGDDHHHDHDDTGAFGLEAEGDRDS